MGAKHVLIFNAKEETVTIKTSKYVIILDKFDCQSLGTYVSKAYQGLGGDTHSIQIKEHQFTFIGSGSNGEHFVKLLINKDPVFTTLEPRELYSFLFEFNQDTFDKDF